MSEAEPNSAAGERSEPGEHDEPTAHELRGSGERLGPYRLMTRLGEGGMGVVYLGLDRADRPVAIKVLRPHIAYDQDARARLEREVNTLARIDHARVASVIDADIGGDRPYLVTRYVSGPSLDDIVADEGALSGARLYELGHGLVEAVEAIHAAGVVHRDIKPGNVLTDERGGPVLIDFGIAQIAEDVRLTSVGLVMGTPGYLSPEVVAGGEVTEATDWWGWAATMAFAASGHVPFGRGRMEVVLDRVRRGEFDLTGVDDRLAPLLAAALSSDPGRRPPAKIVVAAMARYGEGGDTTMELPATGVRRGDTAALPAVAPTPSPAGSPYWYPDPLRQEYRPTSPGPQRYDASARPADEGRYPPSPGAYPPDPAGYPSGYPGNAGNAGPGRLGQAVQGEEPDAWSADPYGPGRGDPRIGQPMRTGTLAAMLLAMVALAAHLPVVAAALTVGWVLAARWADRSVTSLVIRRHNYGHRRSDLPLAVVRSPWHLLVAVLATALSLIVPVVMGVAGAFTAALVGSLTGWLPKSPGSWASVAVGALVIWVVLWWGPASASVRRGSRSLVRGLAPMPIVGQVLIAALVLVAAGLIALTVSSGGALVWWPSSTPLWR